MKFKIMTPAALIGFSTLLIQVDESPNGPYIATSGTVNVDAIPDIATLMTEVNVVVRDAVSAKKQADERVAQCLSFLEQNQTAKKDISVANLHTQPDHDYQNGKSILKGYRVVRTAEVMLHQLNKLNALLNGALKAGPNKIRSVSLGVAQPDTYKDKACKAAIDDAIHQAKQLAAGFNSRLRPVYSVRYYVPNYQPSPMVRMVRVDAAPVTSVQGTYEQPAIQLDDQVGMVFQIESTAGQPVAMSVKTQ